MKFTLLENATLIYCDWAFFSLLAFQVGKYKIFFCYFELNIFYIRLTKSDSIKKSIHIYNKIYLWPVNPAKKKHYYMMSLRNCFKRKFISSQNNWKLLANNQNFANRNRCIGQRAVDKGHYINEQFFPFDPTSVEITLRILASNFFRYWTIKIGQWMYSININLR